MAENNKSSRNAIFIKSSSHKSYYAQNTLISRSADDYSLEFITYREPIPVKMQFTVDENGNEMPTFATGHNPETDFIVQLESNVLLNREALLNLKEQIEFILEEEIEDDESESN